MAKSNCGKLSESFNGGDTCKSESEVKASKHTEAVSKLLDPKNADCATHLLANGCSKIFGDHPVYEERSECGKFVAKCVVGELEGVDTGLTKKSARQKAAKKILLAIVDDGRYKEFGIPGVSKEEAHDYIVQLRLDLENESDERAESWISKCNELRQKNKLPNFDISFREEGEPNHKIFYYTVASNELKGCGSGRNKKAAHNEACKELYSLLHIRCGSAPCQKTCYNLHEKYMSGDFSAKNKPDSGMPSMVDRAEIRQTVEVEQTSSTHKLAAEFSCDHSSIVRHFHDMQFVFGKMDLSYSQKDGSKEMSLDRHTNPNVTLNLNPSVEANESCVVGDFISCQSTSTENLETVSAKCKQSKKMEKGPEHILLSAQSTMDLCKRLKHAMDVGKAVNYRASMALLNEIIEMQDPIVKKIFDVRSKNSIKFSFVDVRTADGQFQVFLEVQNCSKCRPENVFGGQGATKLEAMDDAAWQALRYLYLFGNIERVIANLNAAEVTTAAK